MWLFKINDEYIKIADLETVALIITKQMKKSTELHEIIDLNDENLLTAIVFALQDSNTYKVETVTHELKITKESNVLNVVVYMKLPSTKVKVKIHEYVFAIDLIDLEKVRVL
jgi:hypothetical protein